MNNPKIREARKKKHLGVKKRCGTLLGLNIGLYFRINAA